jgi:glutaredoxin-like protein NrdH
MTVTLYSKPNCQQCVQTKKVLERKGIEHSVVDISEDRAAYDYVTGLGYRSAPVVVAGEQHWSGFRPDLIDKLAV